MFKKLISAIATIFENPAEKKNREIMQAWYADQYKATGLIPSEDEHEDAHNAAADRAMEDDHPTYNKEYKIWKGI
jgi:hypothetical protein